MGRGENGSSCGITATEIKAGMAPQNDQSVFSGIVPDGVATVTLTWPASQGWPARSATAPVHGNVYAVHVPGVSEPTAQAPNQPAVTWHSAEGRVLKTIPVPTRALEREACRQDPIPCALFQYGGVTATSSSSSSSSTTTQATPAPAH